jgi:pimeloyl-ACP methyl ester carboxylesterase
MLAIALVTEACCMKVKNLLLAAGVATGAMAALRVSQLYRRWMRMETVRLQSPSSLIETALGTVEYRMEGESRRSAILIAHGSPGGYDQGVGFGHLIGDNDYSFISVSRPGYLRTPLASGKTPEAQADLYAALLDALHIEQAAVIGLSGGGPSSIQFALRHPDRCRGLLMVSALTGRYSEREVYQRLPLAKRLTEWLSHHLLIWDPFLFVIIRLERRARQQHHDTSEGLLDSLSMFELRKPGYDNDMQQFEAISAYPLADIHVPTFILHGTADTEVPFDEAKELAALVSNAKLVAIEGGGHLSFIVKQERVMPPLREFLRSL